MKRADAGLGRFFHQVVSNLYRWFGAIGRELRSHRGRGFVIGIPMFWLGLFFLLPFLIVLKISLSSAVFGQAPPYSPIFDLSQDNTLVMRLTWANYIALLKDSLYLSAYLNSLLFAGVSTLIALLLGYPIAYGIARATPVWRLLLLIGVILPFWTSSLLRTYAMIGILKANGLINQLLLGIGLIDTPLDLLYTDLAVYIGIVYNYLPFMILPLTANLMRMDFTLLEAAEDLGAPPWRAFLFITLPLSLPGIIAGAMLVFIPAVGEFVIPDILGGPGAITIGRVLWTEFFNNRDWPLASSVAVAMLLLIVIPTLIFEYVENRQQRGEVNR